MRRGPDLHVRRLLRELNRAPAAKRVVEAVATQRGIAVVLLLHPSRGTAAVAQTRQLAMYLLHVGLSLTYREVGNLFGRDRSTVSYACALIEDLREEIVLSRRRFQRLSTGCTPARWSRSSAMRADTRTRRFVKCVLAGGKARCDDTKTFVAVAPEGTARLSAAAVRRLQSDGVLGGTTEECRPTTETRAWLRRQLLDQSFATAQREEVTDREQRRINLAESPLARLAVAEPGQVAPFLAPHQVEAGERFRRLFERAQIAPRITMNYSSAYVAKAPGQRGAPDISDMAADARRALAAVHAALPADCAGALFDICGLLKGLQLVETERGWPRRSAKLVLRIGLDHLCRHWGLAGEATGTRRGIGGWRDAGARPTRLVPSGSDGAGFGADAVDHGDETI